VPLAGGRPIIEMFAMRKSDKQVRDKEGIPRISGQDSEVTGDSRAPRAGTSRRTNEALSERSGALALWDVFLQRKKENDDTQRRV
jgi:hypothetical protein